MITALHIIYVIEEHFFSFLEREMPSTYANEIKLRTLFFFNFHQNMYSFIDLIYLYLTYFLIGKCFVGGLF